MVKQRVTPACRRVASPVDRAVRRSLVDARSQRRMINTRRSSAAVWASLRMPRSSTIKSGTMAIEVVLRVPASVASGQSNSVCASRCLASPCGGTLEDATGCRLQLGALRGSYRLCHGAPSAGWTEGANPEPFRVEEPTGMTEECCARD